MSTVSLRCKPNCASFCRPSCPDRIPIAYSTTNLVRSAEAREKQQFVANIRNLSRQINRIQRELEILTGDTIETRLKNACSPQIPTCPATLTKSAEANFWFNQCCKVATLNNRLNVLVPILQELFPAEFVPFVNRERLFSVCQKYLAVQKRANAMTAFLF